MGLREKVALATIAVIATRMICSHGMPRDLSNTSVKRHTKSYKFPKENITREFKTSKRLKKNTLNHIVATNDSKVIRFPEVEYPSDSQIWDYYRFQNDYLNIFKSNVTNDITKTTSQIRNFKREAKQKRKYNMVANSIVDPSFEGADLEYDPAPQPYCFRKSSFFPEMEYPLSARDMWIPTFWSRLQDAERDRYVNIDESISPNRIKKAKSAFPKYENSPLSSIIKTLNANNPAVMKTINNNINPNLFTLKDVKPSNNVVSTNDSLNTSNNKLENCSTYDELTTISVFEITTQSDLDKQEVLTFTSDTSLVPTATEMCLPRLTAETSSVTLPLTIETAASIINDNLFRPSYGTTVPMTPHEYSEPFTISGLTCSDITAVTTASPLEYLTSPMTILDMSSEMENTAPTTVSSTTTAIKKTETNFISTTPSLSPSISLSTGNIGGKKPKDSSPSTIITKIVSTGKNDIDKPLHQSDNTRSNDEKFSIYADTKQSTTHPIHNILNDGSSPQIGDILNISKPVSSKQSVNSSITMDKVQPPSSNVNTSFSPISDSSQNLINGSISLICMDNFRNTSTATTATTSNVLSEIWLSNPNNSYVTWETFPEYSDDWIIFVDSPNTSLAQENFTSNNLNNLTMDGNSLLTNFNLPNFSSFNLTQPRSSSVIDDIASSIDVSDHMVTEEKKKLHENDVPTENTQSISNDTVEIAQTTGTADLVKSEYPALLDEGDITKNNSSSSTLKALYESIASDPDSSIVTVISVPDYLDDSWFIPCDIENKTKYVVEEKQPTLNFLMQESNTDQKSNSESCTDIPYDSWILYPEYVNETSSANFNDSYVIYQPISDNSDDGFLLFLNTEKTT